MVFSNTIGTTTSNVLAYTFVIPANFSGTINFTIPMYVSVTSATTNITINGSYINCNFLLSNYKWNINKGGVFYASSNVTGGSIINANIKYTATGTGAGSFTSTQYIGYFTGSFTPPNIGTSETYDIYFYSKLLITSTRTNTGTYYNINGVNGVNASSGGTVDTSTNGTVSYNPASPTFVATSYSITTPSVSSGSVTANIIKAQKVTLPTGGNTVEFNGGTSYVADVGSNLYLRSNNFVNLHGGSGITTGTSLLQAFFGSFTAPNFNGSIITSNTEWYYYLPATQLTSQRFLIQGGASVDRTPTSITFPIAFNSLPYMFATPYADGSASAPPRITAVSSTAFTIDPVATNANKASFNWIAFGMKSN